MRLALSALFAAGLAAPLAGPARAAPVVLELFTSQSCSSCPPADALLAELAREPGVLALDFHVDYWNYLSWHDKFSMPEATARQRSYAAKLGADVYTPQIVVNGAAEAVGSRRADIARLIDAARTAPPGPSLALAADAHGVRVEIGAGQGRAELLLVGFDAEHTTQVAAGENGGRTLREVNVVRDLVPAGDWHGAARALIAVRPKGERVAALLQAADGRILAAASL